VRSFQDDKLYVLVEMLKDLVFHFEKVAKKSSLWEDLDGM